MVVAGNKLWKHIVPLHSLDIASAEVLQKVACLMCVRHPVHWIVSMAKQCGFEYVPNKNARRSWLTMDWMDDVVYCTKEEGNPLHCG